MPNWTVITAVVLAAAIAYAVVAVAVLRFLFGSGLFRLELDEQLRCFSELLCARASGDDVDWREEARPLPSEVVIDRNRFLEMCGRALLSEQCAVEVRVFCASLVEESGSREVLDLRGLNKALRSLQTPATVIASIVELSRNLHLTLDETLLVSALRRHSDREPICAGLLQRVQERHRPLPALE